MGNICVKLNSSQQAWKGLHYFPNRIYLGSGGQLLLVDNCFV